jgi:hypothetical protein
MKIFNRKKISNKKPDSKKAKPVIIKDPDFVQLSTLQILKMLVIKKWFLKEEVRTNEVGALLPPPEDVKIYHLAVVLDGEVKEIIRAQAGLADLLSANPEFIIFDGINDHVHIGSKYEDGEFTVHTHEDNQEIDEIAQKVEEFRKENGL